MRSGGRPHARRPVVALVSAVAIAVAACGSDAESDDVVPGVRDPVEPPAFVGDVREAMAAIEAELGDDTEYFEVTANAQFTNVFVAIEDATAAIPYLYVDGELQPPAPVEQGAAGNTFRSDDVVFEDDMVLSGVANDLPETAIEAISVYGDGVGAIYVLGATSSVGGQLDIVVGPTGAIIAVDPL